MKIKVLIVIGVATVGVAGPAFAQIPVPTVQAPVPVPTVKAPVPVPTVKAPVPVPTVQVPVPVPTVKAPVPVPTVKAPVPVPTVKAPDVPVPAVPGVTAPTGGGGSGGGSSGGSSGSGSSGGSAGSSGGSSGGSSSGSSRSGSGSGSGSSSGGSASGGSSGGGSSSGGASGSSAQSGSTDAGASSGAARGSGASRSATGRAAAAHGSGPSSRTSTKSPAVLCGGQVEGAKRRECELRETVAQSSRCLDDLSAAQRRVLALRAGLGAGPPRSRGGVAKRLKISERRVVRLERTGLRRLRTLAKRGACAPPAQAVTAGDVAPGDSAAAMTANPAKVSGREPAAGGGDGGSGRGRDGASGRRGRGGSGGSDELPRNGGVAGVSQVNPPGTTDLTIPLLLILLLAAIAGVAYALRRLNAAPVPVAGPTDEPAEQSRPVWVPWRRSTMDGPGWTSAPPPSGDGAGEWAAAPGADPEPPAEPEQHDEWIPPSPRRRVH